MAKIWYPVIDYIACIECGTCVDMCPHGVYDTEKAPSPVVKNPEACIDHCHGCGNRCPAGAITYVGDDTGWTPPDKNETAEETCCSCRCGSTSGKKAVVEYLYLDLKTCERCIGTDNVLDEVMLTLTPALKLAGYAAEYIKIEMKTAEIAEQYKFLSSPTIRVNGQDICRSVAENSCGCCSDISGTDTDCRVFEHNGETYEVPPKEMLAEAILRTVFGQNVTDCSCGEDEYKLPENLKNFFDGKKNKSGCACDGKCC
jgi:NAD-dependent dihydropyrimidine dehydrogenase PreA subunit